MSRISCTLFQCKEGGNLSHCFFLSFLLYLHLRANQIELIRGRQNASVVTVTLPLRKASGASSVASPSLFTR